MNVTENQEQFPWEISEHVETFLIILYSVITITAIGGNTIVCYLVFAYKRMHTVPNYFIVNLAISDILLAIFCIPFTFIVNLKNYWPFEAGMCPVVLYIQVVMVLMSSYTLVAMSIDRYIAIVHPFVKRITPRKTVFVIAAIWAISLAIPLPTLLKSRMIYFSNTSGQCLEMWEDQSKKYAYSLALMVLQYFGPLVILIFSYSKIGYNIWVKNFKSDAGNKRRLQLAAAKRKMIKMMITVVVFYALCWLPVHVITLLGDHDPHFYNHAHMPIIWMMCQWLAMSNSCYNPIIYIWMSPKFRTGLLLSLHRCSRTRSVTVDSNDYIDPRDQRDLQMRREPDRERLYHLADPMLKQHENHFVNYGNQGIKSKYLAPNCNRCHESSIHSDT